MTDRKEGAAVSLHRQKSWADKYYPDEERGQYGQKDRYFKKCRHRAGDETVYGHGNGEEKGFSPRQNFIPVLIGF